MTEAKQEKQKPKNLIPKPVSQAFLAGASASALSYVLSVPIEYMPRIALAGAGFSLYLSWSDSRYITKPRKKRGRQIPFNHGSGSQQIDMEFSISQGGYIPRETWKDTFNRLVFGNKRIQAQLKAIEPVEKPGILDEFVFHSMGIQLRKVHVDLFLKSAWRNRKNGKGLSERRWVRNFSQRPAWYKELSPTWYYAMIGLLYNAQVFTGWQIIINKANQQSFLAIEPYHLIRILKWYSYEANKKSLAGHGTARRGKARQGYYEKV